MNKNIDYEKYKQYREMAKNFLDAVQLLEQAINMLDDCHVNFWEMIEEDEPEWLNSWM